MPNELTIAFAVTGAILGAIGTILSLMNTWRGFDRDKVKVRVVPVYGVAIGPGHGVGDRLIGIKTTNLSTFPVVVSEVGFTLRGTTGRLVILLPIIPDGGKLPRRLDSRTSLPMYGDATMLRDPQFRNVLRGYATTVCDETFTGTSKVLKQLVRNAIARPEVE